MSIPSNQDLIDFVLHVDVHLRQFVLAFAEMLSPRLTPALIERAMSGQGTDYQL